jgi:NADH-quinone oxidoreductase subunit J
MPPVLQNFISAQVLLFLLFGLGALVAAVVMVLNPNPVRSALFLVLDLFCVAVMYLLLNAYFLAAVQIIVYTGAIMVLFLFVIMLLNLGTPDRQQDELKWQQPVAVVAGLALAGVFGLTIYSSVPSLPVGKFVDRNVTNPAATSNLAPGQGAPTTEAPNVAAAPAPPGAPKEIWVAPALTAKADRMGSVEGVGNALYDPEQPWLFPFEVTSILLLIAVVGSVVLAGRRRPGETIPPLWTPTAATTAPEPANPYAMEDDDE